MRLFVESTKISFKSILSNKLRSALTILGIVLGVFTISTLLSLSLGVKKDISSQIEDLGANFVAVVSGKLSNEQGGYNPASTIGASTLTEKDFNSLESELPEGKNLSMVVLISGTVKVGDRVSPGTFIFGSTEKSAPLLNVKLKEGRYVEKEDLIDKKKVVVLGNKVVQTLFDGNNPLGKTVEVRGQKFEVVGTLQGKKEANSFFGPNVNDMMLMPMDTGWELTNSKQIFRIMLQAPNTDSVKEYKSKVKDIILKSHGFEEDFTVITQEDALGIVGNILNLLTAMIVAIALLSLIIGGIGIMNIMLVSISERTKEIGIRKAVGANRVHILIQFLVEAVSLSIIGGLIGLGLSAIVANLASRYSPIHPDFSLFVVLLAIGFSALIGVVFGVIPAWSASKKDPIEAIRSE